MCSENVFSFHNVEVTSMTPPFGPVSGGTPVVLFGRHLGAGSRVEVMIGDNPCVVRERNSSSSITCVTTAGKRVQSVGPLRLSIDNATRSVSSLTFEYRPDPIIHSITPLSAFRSGGRLITVKGVSLDAVLTARLFLLSSHDEPTEIISDLAPCQILNATLMHCLSPALVSSEQQPSTVSSWALGLQMDNVSSLRRLPRRFSLSIVPDPHFEPFDGVRVHLSGQSLILDGKYLGMAAEARDYKIQIGSSPCTVTVLDDRQLVCTPPMEQPEAKDEKEKSLLSSLLISALASNFDYLTQVVLILLREHIASTVQHRSPTLVFRQSESLVELLFQKWFSLCMYDFVCDRGAPQLQTLHAAFKLQSDRGPVDCVTGAARYTINESKLLRETVDASPIDLLITSMEGRGPFAVRVLACDSISQVRRRAIDAIYRAAPATGKPHAGHVIMEWQRPDGECIQLRDTEEGDSTGRRNGKTPKRIQTVTSAGLTHGSLLLTCATRRTRMFSSL